MKRLGVSLLETACEALLLGLCMFTGFCIQQGTFSDQFHSFVGGVFIIAGEVEIMFFVTGYIVTSAIFRIMLSGRQRWLYPTVAVGLFVIHSEIFLISTGGLTYSERLYVQICGILIVLMSTHVGGRILSSG